MWLRGSHTSCTNWGRGIASGTNQCFSRLTLNHRHLGTLLKFSRDLRMCISNKFSGVVDAFGLGPHFENCCHRHLQKIFGTKWFHNGLCFYVAGSHCHLGTTIFSFQGKTHFFFSVFDPNPPLLPPTCYEFLLNKHSPAPHGKLVNNYGDSLTLYLGVTLKVSS